MSFNSGYSALKHYCTGSREKIELSLIHCKDETKIYGLTERMLKKYWDTKPERNSKMYPVKPCWKLKEALQQRSHAGLPMCSPFFKKKAMKVLTHIGEAISNSQRWFWMKHRAAVGTWPNLFSLCVMQMELYIHNDPTKPQGSVSNGEKMKKRDFQRHPRKNVIRFAYITHLGNLKYSS